jgi:hypothetical protein
MTRTGILNIPILLVQPRLVPPSSTWNPCWRFGASLAGRRATTCASIVSHCWTRRSSPSATSGSNGAVVSSWKSGHLCCSTEGCRWTRATSASAEAVEAEVSVDVLVEDLENRYPHPALLLPECRLGRCLALYVYFHCASCAQRWVKF